MSHRSGDDDVARQAATASPDRTGDGAGMTQAILEATPGGIVVVGEDGLVRLCNPAAEALLGRDAGELLGGPFGLPVDTGRVTDVRLTPPGRRERIVEMRVRSTTATGERLHVVALCDVTRRRRAEEELERALERHHVTAAVVAHELRTPLAAIRTFAEVLRDPTIALAPERRAEILDRIVDRTHRLRVLVAKLLTVSRIELEAAGAPRQPVPLLELMRETLADFGDRSGDVRLSCDPGLAVFADRGELYEILVNCLENALAYGGPPVEARAVRHHGLVELTVHDAGPGVPADFVPRLFDRFTRDSTAGRRAEGSGLGLWIVRRLARANGGDVRYEPGAGGGACFRITLPLAPGS
jgi:signal transduction histidine kinase